MTFLDDKNITQIKGLQSVFSAGTDWCDLGQFIGHSVQRYQLNF